MRRFRTADFGLRDFGDQKQKEQSTKPHETALKIFRASWCIFVDHSFTEQKATLENKEGLYAAP